MAAGTYTFTIGANSTSAVGAANYCTPANKTYSVIIRCNTLTLAELPDAFTSAEYRYQLSAALGLLPYSFGITSGALPSNMSLALGGLLTGTPSVRGTYTVRFNITDYNGCNNVVEKTLTVNCGTAAYVLPTALPDGDTSSPYEVAFVTDGTLSFSLVT